MVTLRNPWGVAEVRRQGAHVLSYVPAGERDLLWVSPAARWEPGEPLRGGIPLCVPWFASAYPGKPAHGFGRNRIWETIGPVDLPDGTTQVVFSLEDDDETRVLWPFFFRFEHEITLGPTLNLAFRAWNRGPSPFRLELVWHTYFAIDDVTQIQIQGLEGETYLDKNRARTPGTVSGTFAPTGAYDLIFPRVGEDQSFTDGRRSVSVSSDAPGAVVWNIGERDQSVADLGPGTHQRYLCLERGILDTGARTVDSGELLEVRMSVGYNQHQ